MALPFHFKSSDIIDAGRTNQLAVNTLKEWTKTTSLPQLPDEFIVLFLIKSENNIDHAKETIEAYFKIKNASPQIFNSYSMESKDINKTLNVLGFGLMPKRMENNIAVIFQKVVDTNYRNLDVDPAIKLFCMTKHISQMDDPPNELIIVGDFKGIGFMHLTCIKMASLTAYLQYIQEGMPVKIRYIHVLNSNYIFEKILGLFKMMIKSEFLAKIKTHSPKMKIEEFHKEWVPAAYLPKEYGGDISLDELMKDTTEKLRKNMSFFEEEERLRSACKS